MNILFILLLIKYLECHIFNIILNLTIELMLILFILLFQNEKLFFKYLYYFFNY